LEYGVGSEREKVERVEKTGCGLLLFESPLEKGGQGGLKWILIINENFQHSMTNFQVKNKVGYSTLNIGH